MYISGLDFSEIAKLRIEDIHDEVLVYFVVNENGKAIGKVILDVYEKELLEYINIRKQLAKNMKDLFFITIENKQITSRVALETLRNYCDKASINKLLNINTLKISFLVYVLEYVANEKSSIGTDFIKFIYKINYKYGRKFIENFIRYSNLVFKDKVIDESYILTKYEIKLMKTTMRTFDMMQKRDYVMISLMCDAGFTVDQIVDLQFGNFEQFCSGIFFVKDSKNIKRTYSCLSSTEKLLQQYLDLREVFLGDSPYIFVDLKGKQLTKDEVIRIIEKNLKNAQINKIVSNNMFRDSYALYCLANFLNKTVLKWSFEEDEIVDIIHKYFSYLVKIVYNPIKIEEMNEDDGEKYEIYY